MKRKVEIKTASIYDEVYTITIKAEYNCLPPGSIDKIDVENKMAQMVNEIFNAVRARGFNCQDIRIK